MKLTVLTAMHLRPDLNRVFGMAMKRLRDTFDIDTCVAVTLGDDENIAICDEYALRRITCNNNPVSNKFNTGMGLLRDMDWTHVMILGSDDFPSNRFVELQMQHEDKDFIAINDMWFWGLNPSRAGWDTLTYWNAGSSRIGAGRVISRRVVEACGYKLWPDGRNYGLDGGSVANIRNHINDLSCVGYDQRELGGFLMDVKYEKHISSLSPVLSRGERVDVELIYEHLPEDECNELMLLRDKAQTICQDGQ